MRATSGRNLGLSADGMVVDFGYELWGEGRARFDLATLTLSADPPADGRTAPPVQQGLTVTDWINSTDPRLDGKPLPLDAYEISRSLAIASRRQALPARDRVVSARLRCRGRRALAAASAGHRLGGEYLRRRPAGARGLRRRHAALAPDGGRRRAAGALPLRRRQRPLGRLDAGGLLCRLARRLRRARLGGQPRLGRGRRSSSRSRASRASTSPRRSSWCCPRWRPPARSGSPRSPRTAIRVQEAVQSAAPPGAQLHVLAIGVERLCQPRASDARLRRRRRRGPRDGAAGAGRHALRQGQHDQPC